MYNSLYPNSTLKPVAGQRVSGTTVRNKEDRRVAGTFIEISKYGDTASIRRDDGQQQHVWFDKNFRIEQPNKRFIIIAEIAGKLEPALRPREYVSREQAEKVALTMAETHDTKMFVFESSTYAEPPVKVFAKLVNL